MKGEVFTVHNLKDAPRTIGVYAIRNTRSGKVYVGSAGARGSGGGFRKRWRKHVADLRSRTHHSQALQRAWDRHGDGAFVFQVLELVAPGSDLTATKRALLEAEQRHIDASGAAAAGYNCSPTAGSRLGVVDRPEVKAACAERARKRVAQGIPGFIGKGGTHSQEARSKIAAAHAGKAKPPSVGKAAKTTAQQRALAGTGIFAPESRAKAINAWRAGIEERRRLGIGEFSPQAIAKKSAAMKRSWADRKLKRA